VNQPDFEISADLRATQLAIHVVPEADVAEIGDGVTLTRRETRSGLPNPPERERRYADVAIEKHTTAVTNSERTALHDQQPRDGGVEHNG
jgi:hypothetical protein